MRNMQSVAFHAAPPLPKPTHTATVTMDVGLVEALCDYSRPVFLFGACFLFVPCPTAASQSRHGPIDRESLMAVQSSERGRDGTHGGAFGLTGLLTELRE